MTAPLVVQDRGQTLEFFFEDILKYHGPGSPGGVANAFKVMERAFALLSPDEPPQRREITLRTAFGGPGARDAFEVVTRAVTEDRFTLDPALAQPDRGRALERFVFEVGAGGDSVTLRLREGYVTEEFIDLARTDGRSQEQEARFAALKAEVCERVMAADAADVYDLVDA